MVKNPMANLRKATEKVIASGSTQEKIDALSKAFQLFTHETMRLETAYHSLKQQFESVNQELEQANVRLKLKVSELDVTTYYLENILSNMSQGLIFVGLDGMITTYNQAAETFLGVERNQALFDTFSDVFPDDMLGFSMRQALSQAAAPKYSHFSWPKDKKGRSRDLEVETKFVLKSNTDTEEINLNPVHDFTKGLILLIRDVTELHNLQTVANRNDRMKVLGEMAAMVAHEIRNPLGGIKGFASLLMRDLQDKPELQDMAANIVQGTDNLNKLLTNILNYVRPLTLDLHTINIADTVHHIIQHIRFDSALSEKFTFREHYPSNSVLAKLDPQLLKSALLNVIVNAVQAMPDGGEIVISAKEDAGYVVIAIADAGEGIPESLQEKIFRPFFTTKPLGHGFGLAEVHRVVQAHNGMIEVKSIVGKGTTFFLKFPLNNILEKVEVS